jgi:TetR/AcrR family fatty acid metabolism transcriptional regulator
MRTLVRPRARSHDDQLLRIEADDGEVAAGVTGDSVKPRQRSSRPLTRDQILDEAARQILERGIERVRIQDIADEFGVTHAAIYYYFKKKSHLLAELNLRALDALIEGAKTALEQTDTAERQFIAQLRAHVMFIVKNTALAACLFQSDKEIEPQSLAQINRGRKAYNDIIVDSFSAAQRDGAFRADLNPRLAVNVLIGAANWMPRWITTHGDADDTAMVETVTLLLAHGPIKEGTS